MNAPLILSLFPGIDMLGSGFEATGYTVLRGPDKLLGGDIRTFTAPRGVFLGVIGGSPCQDFSDMRRTAPTGEGLELLGHFARCVDEARPEWFLLENVRKVPAIAVQGYTVQRLHVRASEFGAQQHRLRIFQFGYRDGLPLILRRPVASPTATQGAALATEGNRGTKRRGWAAFCALQGFTTPPELDSFTKAGKYRAVGNGVDLRVARGIAQAIRDRSTWQRQTHPHSFAAWEASAQPCACGCGRPVDGKRYAETACRKRAQRARDAAQQSAPQAVTPTPCTFADGIACNCGKLGCPHRDYSTVSGPGPVTARQTRFCTLAVILDETQRCTEQCDMCSRP